MLDLGVVDFYKSSRGAWTDFKIHVTSWDDGTGYGRYDIWVNSGLGWSTVVKDNPFAPSELHNSVNAMLFRPRSPVGMIDAYVDDISISSEPLDCQDTLIMGYGKASDINQDCYVDLVDLEIYVTEWLTSNDPCNPNSEVIEEIVLEQNFDDLPTGSIGLGVGDAGSLGGRWRDLGVTSTDPYIVDTTDPVAPAAHSGEKSLRLRRYASYGDGTATQGIGWTTADSIDADAPFELSFWIYPLAKPDNLCGSWTVRVNNYNNIQTKNPVAIYLDHGHNLRVRTNDGSGDAWLDTLENLPDSAWTGIKLAVTDWNKDGRGYYDAYVNYGSGWTLVTENIAFNPDDLYGGVNSVEMLPSSPAGEVVGYMDDIKLGVAGLQSCADVLAVDKAKASDINCDCYVNLKDFALLAEDWLWCNEPTDGDCIAAW